MSQWLRAIDPIAKNSDSGACTHMGAHNCPSARELNSFGHHGHTWCTYIHRDKHRNKTFI